MRPEDLVAEITARRYPVSCESELQHHLGELLWEIAGARSGREIEVAPGDRIDFVVGRVGIEVKVAGSLAEVTRQLHRYAGSPALDAVVLVTTRATHRAVPNTLQGKPCRVAYLSPL